jgi:hypothetical protein
MGLPGAKIPRDERMPAVAMHRAVAVVAEVEAVKTFAVRLVVLEAQMAAMNLSSVSTRRGLRADCR